MAVRERKVFILGTPELPNAEVRIFFDVEGDPERGFDYLIGVLIEENGTEQRFSLWADSPEQEGEIVERFLEIVEKYENPRLFCYGSYDSCVPEEDETASRKERIDRVLDRTTNVLSVIYSNVYFPVYSNGLKEVGGRLGCRWSGDNASGLQSIVWRRSWEVGRDEGLKRTLEVYNMEDCSPSEPLLGSSTGSGSGVAPRTGEEGRVGLPWSIRGWRRRPSDFSRREWCKANFSLPDFNSKYQNTISASQRPPVDRAHSGKTPRTIVFRGAVCRAKRDPPTTSRVMLRPGGTRPKSTSIPVSAAPSARILTIAENACCSAGSSR